MQEPEEFIVRDRRGEEKPEEPVKVVEPDAIVAPSAASPPPNGSAQEPLREVTWRIPRRLHAALVHWAKQAVPPGALAPGSVSTEQLATAILTQGVAQIERQFLAQQEEQQRVARRQTASAEQLQHLSSDPDEAAAQIQAFMAQKGVRG